MTMTDLNMTILKGCKNGHGDWPSYEMLTCQFLAGRVYFNQCYEV